MRYILIKEGFESKDYIDTVIASSDVEAIVRLRERGNTLNGMMLLEVAASGPYMVRLAKMTETTSSDQLRRHDF